jgi:DNA-binding transcriptional MerR regulator
MSEFPIRILSEQTGVPATTLRAWERRYGLLNPARTPKGHRLYNQTDLEKVRQIVQLLEAGSTISKAVKIIRDGGSFPTGIQEERSPWELSKKRVIQAIEAFDDRRLDALYNQALAVYPIDIVTVSLLLPVLQGIGERWSTRKNGVAKEHFFTAWLRNKIGARMHHEAGRTRGRRLLLACLPGEHHELGILLFGLSALTHGYRILYLGPDLPLSQVKEVVADVDVSAVLLSGTSEEAPEIWRQLSQLAEIIDIPLFIGGGVSDRPEEMPKSQNLPLLGANYSVALERLEESMPAFGAL